MNDQDANLVGEPETKSCPYCGEKILAAAIKCKHCGSAIASVTSNKQNRKRSPQLILLSIVLIVAALFVWQEVASRKKVDLSKLAGELSANKPHDGAALENGAEVPVADKSNDITSGA